MVQAWKELNAMRGLTARQARLLDLEALCEGTNYDELLAWEPAVQCIGGIERFIPSCERKPEILTGLVGDKVEKLLDRLVGEGRAATLHDLPPGVEDAAKQMQLLGESAFLPTRDLVVKGSGALGFARLGTKRFEPIYLDTTWCEPVFVAQAGDARAAEIAAELEALDVALPSPKATDHLATPEDADSHDLCFLRYEYPYAREEREVVGGASTRTRTYRRRVDYLPHVILEYEDLAIDDGQQVAPRWRLARPPRPHNWGVVPIAWARSRGARPGEPDGPSLVTPALASVAKAADYAESMKHDAVKLQAWPQLAEIDLDSTIDRVNAENSIDGRVPATPSTPAAVLRYRSRMNQKGELKLVETTGTGIDAGRKHVEDLRRHADRISGILEHDQSQAAGALSGTALERMLEPTIARVNAYRASLTNLFTTLVRKLGVVLGEDASAVVVQWPRVVAMTPADLQAAATALSTAAGGAAVISQKTAVELFAKLAEIASPDDELALVEGDVADAMQRAKDAFAARPPIADPKAGKTGADSTGGA